MELYNGLPLFDLDVVDDMNGVEIISLVDRPAVEREFVAFSQDERYRFSIKDEEKRIVNGVALIPDQKIYRRAEDGTEFYVRFSRDAIERIAQKFFADHNSTNVNLEHQVEVDDCVYFESYLLDSKRGICPVEFSDCPDGTWIVSAKINNDKVWELVKQGVLRGFSIEGNLHIEPSQSKALDTVEEFMDWLKKQTK